MWMFTLAISCLTTSNLLWFMDLTFQVHMYYCSLQHWALIPSPVISTTRCCFCSGSISSFFRELFLHSSPVAYWAPNDLGSSSFSVLSFYLFVLFMGFPRQEVWLVFYDCGFHSVCLMKDKDKKLMESSWWERLTVGETGSCSEGRGMLSKSLIQFYIDGWGCVPSLLFDLRPNYGGGNEDNGGLLQKIPCMHCGT